MGLAPALLGLLAVLQAGLNRRIAGHWGLAPTVFLNATVLLLSAVTLLALNAWRPEVFPVRTPDSWKGFSLWFVLPGLCGFSLVIGGPWAIARWGAVHTFILLISGQLVASLLWDYFVEDRSISPQRGIGVLFAWIGAFLATRG